MHIENMSLASLARSAGGGVGVNDLREALGRGSVSNPALATASLNSTLDRNSSLIRKDANHPEPLAITRIKSKRGRAPPSEVRDVLNKLGIGKQSSGGPTLRAPFLQSSNEAAKIDTEKKRDTSLAEPPY
jgi:protein EFR3